MTRPMVLINVLVVVVMYSFVTGLYKFKAGRGGLFYESIFSAGYGGFL